jgi:hypothetical protein
MLDAQKFSKFYTFVLSDFWGKHKKQNQG